MKIQRVVLSILVAGLFAINSISAETDPKLNWKSQMVSYLDNIDLSQITEVEEVMIDFMVNDQSEIIVLATNVDQLDSTIKARLNYKKIKTDQFSTFQKYTLPVKFNKK